MTGAEKPEDSRSNSQPRLDANVVDFDGDDDPQNAMNWSSAKKTVTIVLVSTMTMLSHVSPSPSSHTSINLTCPRYRPIGSTISSAASSEIMTHFHSTNESLEAFVTTIYLLGYAVGPIAIAPLSEIYGRSILYKTCMILFVIFNIACAVANSLGSLIVFRLLTGVAGSCPVALGTGSIADMIPREKRGGAMAAYMIGAVLGPSIGPVCGGYITLAAGWRWCFWVMAIASGIVAAVVVFTMPESYPYVLLKRKTERLRKETGNTKLRSALDTGKKPGQLFAFSIFRPLKMLLSPVVFSLSLYAAVVYSYLYISFTTFPRVFHGQYGFGSGESGLATLGLGVGSLVGVVFCGAVTDRLSNRLTRIKGGEPQPEYRLPTLAVGAVCVPIGLFWYGWTAENKTHWIVPIIGTVFLSGGMLITYVSILACPPLLMTLASANGKLKMASTMYLVDTYTVYAASVTASSTILRCLFGALLPLAGPAMYDALGVGWGTSLLGFISVAFIPLPFIFYFYGQRLREAKYFNVEF